MPPLICTNTQGFFSFDKSPEIQNSQTLQPVQWKALLNLEPKLYEVEQMLQGQEIQGKWGALLIFA